MRKLITTGKTDETVIKQNGWTKYPFNDLTKANAIFKQLLTLSVRYTYVMVHIWSICSVNYCIVQKLWRSLCKSNTITPCLTNNNVLFSSSCCLHWIFKFSNFSTIFSIYISKPQEESLKMTQSGAHLNNFNASGNVARHYLQCLIYLLNQK